MFFYAVAINAMIQFAISMFKAFIVPNYALGTLMVFVIEMSTMMLVSIIMAIVFACSLKKTKTLVNACLIKVGLQRTTRTTKAVSEK